MGSEQMSKEFDQKLLEAYFDGECSDDERVTVERWLEEVPECQEAYVLLGEVRAALKEPVTEALQQADFGAMWSNIQKEIAEPEPVRNVVEEPAEKTGLWSRFLQAFGGQPLVPVAGLALIAAWVVMGPENMPETGEQPGTEIAEAPTGDASEKEVEKAGVHIAYVSGVEYDSGTVILDQNLDDPSEPLIVWHIEGDDNGASKGG